MTNSDDKKLALYPRLVRTLEALGQASCQVNCKYVTFPLSHTSTCDRGTMEAKALVLLREAKEIEASIPKRTVWIVSYTSDIDWGSTFQKFMTTEYICETAWAAAARTELLKNVPIPADRITIRTEERPL